METFILFCLIAFLLVRWVMIRNRFYELEQRIMVLERVAVAPTALPPRREPAPAPVATPPASRPAPPPPATVVVSPPPLPAPMPPHAEPVIPRVPEPAPATPRRTSEDWEALIGGNWANKLGVFVTVIALALLLKYAYAELGPAGRIALSLGVSFAMLAAGVIFEHREAYRTFAYGLIGGGWAALYTTVYAMYDLPAAKVIANPLLATILLLGVVAGMIVHSLKYRSQTVTGLAYFLAFVALGISDVTTFSVIMLIPLAASLLYVSHRNQWSEMAIFGLIATYVTCGLHKDTGSPLLLTQTLFLVYWLVFEAFDLIRPNRWLLPLNALGFLALSGGKWSHTAPHDMWQLAAGAATLYLGSTIVRAHLDRWRPAVLLNAALATTAIVLKLHGEWAILALALEAELYYLAGVRFRSTFLRTIAGAIFVIEAGILLIRDIPALPARTWEPVAALNVIFFYLNRALQATEVWYGYGAAAAAALVAGFEASAAGRGPLWSAMATAPFAFGVWRRLRDFRYQGYGLLAAGIAATTLYLPYPAWAVAITSAVAYGFVHAALWTGRLDEAEADAVRIGGSLATAIGAATIIWRLVPGDYLGIGWMALALVLLETGLRNWPAEFRMESWAIFALAAARVGAFDLSGNFVLVSAVIAYAFAWRERDKATDVTAVVATIFLLAGLHNVLPAVAVSTSWAIVALLLAEFRRASLRVQSLLVSAIVFTRCVAIDIYGAQAVLAILPPIACFWAAMLRRERNTRERLYYSLLATVLLAVLIYQEVSGSVLTIAWGVEGIALLAAGFALHDRVPRISGLAMLLGCILKLFLWDLRNLETLPRIFSFIVLGLLLVGVSWVYTRFRDEVRRYL